MEDNKKKKVATHEDIRKLLSLKIYPPEEMNHSTAFGVIDLLYGLNMSIDELFELIDKNVEIILEELLKRTDLISYGIYKKYRIKRYKKES